MIRKDKHKFRDGTYKTQIRVTDGYRDRASGKAKQLTVKSFGYLEDQANPEKFLEEVIKFDREYKKDKKTVIESTSTKAFYDDDGINLYNFGYKYLEAIYDTLNLDKFFLDADYKGYSLNKTLKYLVINRLINPDSKRATYQRIETMYGLENTLSLSKIYRALDKYAENSIPIQKHLNEQVKKLYGRNTKHAFYDVTNFYFEHDFEDDDEYEEVIPIITDKKKIKDRKLVNYDIDGEIHQFEMAHKGLLKKGVSKEHSLNPIAQLGLFMDDKGLPINMQVFPGNTSDSKTLPPVMSEIKKNYNLERIIVVADKGMNCSENLDMICNNGDGYMFSQILRGKKGVRYQERLFNENLYTIVDEDYKYQIFEETYNSKDPIGNVIERKRKVLIYYSGPEARREKKKRDEKLKKAENSLKNNAFSIVHGYGKYVKQENSVKDTGEVANVKTINVDYDMADNDAKYDGYFCIITSELDFDEKKIRESYHGLWRIEESFRITKSDLIARPVFVRTENHINGHFLICFIALLIIRLLQHKMNYSISVERIVRALNMCSCSEITKGTIHILKKDTFQDFDEKKSKNGVLYKVLTTNNCEETVNDFKKVVEHFDGKVSQSLLNKSVFDKNLRTIKFKVVKS